ncbi:3-keto-5-aminohexanoate cleavage protein [Kribbella sp. NPDC003557]|uniref:3-keto-5-aminohexanoate cleavage protein n=1 Tax=Kribbella sp. NPDC003557 TaxID=3154449 RepID=UPI0033A3DA99
MIKACLNGDRSRADHPGVPVTPDELARAGAAAVAAGADALHIHPRGADGLETLGYADIHAALTAVRRGCPSVPVGVSTREGIVPDLDDRLLLIGSWKPGPDFASVNFHEAGAERVADLLVERGIGVEAGLFTPSAARRYLAWQGPVTRVLVEAIPGISPGVDGAEAATAVLSELPTTDDVLVHGENEWAWPVLAWARSRGYDLRIGLEDVLTGPEGQVVASNAELLRFV